MFDFDHLQDFATDEHVLIHEFAGGTGRIEYWPGDRYLYIYDRDGNITATFTADQLQYLANMVKNRSRS